MTTRAYNLLPVLVVVVTAGTGSCGGPAVEEGDPQICRERGQGALIDFLVAGEPIRLWLESDAFIDESISVMLDGDPRIPIFEEVRLGSDCDERHRFHVDPAAVSWVDAATEACDATPSYIDGDPKRWIASIGSWCPFKVSAIDRVVDCRDLGP